MVSMPSVSAVIPHYGDAAPTVKLIESLTKQIYDGTIEIIVSDDKSPVPFPALENVKVFHRAENGGFGSNVNSGAELATGDWLFILNSDLEISEDFVKNMMAEALKFDSAVLSPQVLGHDGSGQYVARKFPTTFYHCMSWFTPLARIRDTSIWHRLVGHDVHATTGKTLATDWVVGACMVMPLAKFREIGGFDERFFMNSEEVDLQKRLREVGCPAVFAGKVTVLHEGGGSSDSAKSRMWLTHSWLIYANKWGFENQLLWGLRLTSILNFGFNSLRWIRDKNIQPLKTLTAELKFLKQEKK